MDLYNMRMVCKRFSKLSLDMTLSRHANCTGNYWLSVGKLYHYLQPVTKHLETLNLGHCYWIQLTDFDVIRQCTRLRCLNLAEILVPFKTLCEVLSSLPFLTSLSFSIRNINDMHAQLAVSPRAQLCLSQLRKLEMHFIKFNHPTIYNAGPTVFEYCWNVEEISVYATPNIDKRVQMYASLPHIIQIGNLRNVKAMAFNAWHYPVARAYFVAALSAVCRLHVQLSSLLQPSRVTYPMYIHTLGDVSSLVNLDISGTRIIIPTPLIDFHTARSLRYINLADNDLVFGESLRLLAHHCPLLTSVNLQNCINVIYDREIDYSDPEIQEHLILDMGGIRDLVMYCEKLQHLNLSGVHIHAHDLGSTQSLTMFLFIKTNWKSLSLSPCSLREHICDANKSDLNFSSRCDTCYRLLCSPQNALEMTTWQFDLEPLIVNSPEMESFELICTGFTSCTNNPCPASAHVRDEDLVHIGRWYKLKSLQLTAIPGVCFGECLVAIATGCVSLQQLSISNLGQMTYCSYTSCLLRSFPLFTKLKDLRLEQPRLKLDWDFLAGVARCTNLERVCIISANGSYNRVGVWRLFKALPRLVSFQLFTENSVEESVELRQILMDKYRASRSALNISIHPIRHSDFNLTVANTQADQHIDELTICKSRVAFKPPVK